MRPAIKAHDRRLIRLDIVLLLLLVWAVQGCATQAGVKQPPRLHVARVAPGPYPLWKEIDPGKTTKAEMNARFALGQPSGSVFLYRIDAIGAAVAYNRDDTVSSIRTVPAIQITAASLAATYPNPTRERKVDSRLLVDYDDVGLSIEFASPAGPAAAVVIHSPKPPVSDTDRRLFNEVLPIRPPLADLPQHVAIVEAVLRQTAGGYSWVGSERERSQGESMYNQLLQESKLLDDPYVEEYLQGLIRRLGEVTPEAPFPWKLGVIDMPEPNAVNLGGGYILVTRGLFEQMDNEAELAYVVSHEMAHQLKQHVAIGETRAEAASIVILAAAIAVGVATGNPMVVNSIQNLGSVGTQAALAPMSREQERDADLIALNIMNEAGYDPRAIATAIQKTISFRDKYGATTTFLSSHPEPEVRLSEAQAWIGGLGDRDFSARIITTQEFIQLVRKPYRPGSRWDPVASP